MPATTGAISSIPEAPPALVQRAKQLKQSLMESRSAGPSIEVNDGQRGDAASLLGRLKAFRFRLAQKARSIYSGPSKPGAKEDLKKIAYVLYLDDFFGEVHRHAIKENRGEDFDIFLTGLASTVDFLEKDYLSRPIENVSLSFTAFQASFEACSEIYGLSLLDMNAAIRKYLSKASKFVDGVEQRDRKALEGAMSRLTYLEKSLEGDGSAFRADATSFVLRALEREGVNGVGYGFSPEKAGSTRPPHTRIIVRKADVQHERNAKIAKIAQSSESRARSEMAFLRKVKEKKDSGRPLSAEEMSAVSELGESEPYARFLSLVK